MTQKKNRDMLRSAMPHEPPSRDPEWPSWLLEAGRLFGLSPIQTRWKLSAVARKWRSLGREVSPASRKFEHQICAACGALQDHSASVCTSCGERLASPVARFFRTLGLSVPTFISASSLLGAASIVVYFRMMLAFSGQGIGGWEDDALIAHGLLEPRAFFGGQWWRVGTAIFLHLGIWHIVFNTLGLSQIGPTVEEIFGRGRMVFFYAVTGVLAFVASAVLMPSTPTAGASGALMGLIGVAAGWGHRRGTSQGIDVRNQMLKWAAYTMVFGIMLNANHVAHAVGFIAGALLGLAFQPEGLRHARQSVAAVAMGVVGSVACIGFVMIALFPPASARALATQYQRADRFGHDSFASERQFKAGVDRACELLDQGQEADALIAIRAASGSDAEIDRVKATCVFLAYVKAHCAEYRSGAHAPGLGDAEGVAGEADEGALNYYRLWCAKKE